MINYLEYYQLILHKVSFDRRLFNKEYNKAVRQLNYEQRTTLELWVQSMGYAHLVTSAKTSVADDVSRQVSGISNLQSSASLNSET